MIEGSVRFTGRTLGDVDLALAEARRMIADGFTSGGNSNDTGSFAIEVDGEEDPAEHDFGPEDGGPFCRHCGVDIASSFANESCPGLT